MTTCTELLSFFEIMDLNYKNHSSEYPMITCTEIKCFKDRMTDLSNNVIDSDTIYDPIMEPLVQSSLANFLYIKKYSSNTKLPYLKEFHPNYVRYQFMDQLIENKTSVTLGFLKLYEFNPGTSSMDICKLKIKVDSLLVNPILKILVNSYILKLQVGSDQIDRILDFVQTKKKPTKGIGLLYFLLMDLYLEHLDLFIYETLNAFNLKNCFWSRCMNSAVLGFTDKKTVLKFNEILQLPFVFTAWGLTAKVRSCNRGGKVLRPWRGKLYISTEGVLQWERPESIIEI